MGKIGGGRNYGYGKQLAWAAKNALKDRYGSGHFSTRATHEARWQPFVTFLKAHHIKDARDIRKDHIHQYAQQLNDQVRSKEMQVAYAQNLLSTVNVVLGTLRKDTVLTVPPATLVGERTHIRKNSPRTVDRSRLQAPLQRLQGKGETHLAMIVLLCREFGLRFKEASLLNVQSAYPQAITDANINITQGTKGGRGKGVDRWVPVTSQGLQLLDQARSLIGKKTNLIPESYNYIQWRHHAYHQWRCITENTDICGFHDLRAAYACDRYEQITGHPAPVLNGRRTVDKALDLKARTIIALELGHNRTEVLAAYIGSAK